MAEVKASGPSHVLELWMGVIKGMLPVEYIRSNKSSFCVSQISLRSQGCHKDEVNLVTLRFEDITGCKTVVSVYIGLHHMYISVVISEKYVCM